jgi:hypothetical protein
MMGKVATSLTGAAGQHYVMAQLLRNGFIAALAPEGVPTADIVVTDAAGTSAYAIQVKTRREIGSDGGWHMKAKHEGMTGDKLFYVFLNFPADKEKVPDLFVLPANIVAEVLRQSHINWLKKAGKNGKPHKDNIMRRLLPDHSKHDLAEKFGPGWLEQYRNTWDQLSIKQ